MYISYRLNSGTIGTSVDGTASVSRGFGAMTTPVSASQTANTYQPSAGYAGVVIGGDTTIRPQIKIERLRIWGRALTTDAWTLRADINYATMADATGATLGDGLVNADSSYYISGGRLMRDNVGTGLKPHYLNTVTDNWQWVEIIADDATTVPGTSASNARCFGVCHLNTGLTKFLYGGFRFRTTSPSTITRETAIGYCDLSTDVTDAIASVGTAPGHGGWFGRASFMSASGTTINITAGNLGLGGYTPNWQWYYATVADGAGTAITGASGTGYPADLSWAVPAPQQGVPLWIWCEAVANSQTIYISNGGSSSQSTYDSTTANRVRIPAQVTVPATPDDTALGVLFDQMSVAATTIGFIGDSITNSGASTVITVLNAISASKGHGNIFTGINAGKGGSAVADWRASAAVSGSAISVLDNTKNNMNGLIAAFPTSGRRVVSVELGTNDSFDNTTWKGNADGILSDFLASRAGVPMVCHTFPVKTVSVLTDVQQGHVGMRAYWLSRAGTQGGMALAGTAKMFALFAGNTSYLADGIHPTSPTGYDAWARLVAEGLLTQLAALYPRGAGGTSNDDETLMTINTHTVAAYTSTGTSVAAAGKTARIQARAGDVEYLVAASTPSAGALGELIQREVGAVVVTTGTGLNLYLRASGGGATASVATD